MLKNVLMVFLAILFFGIVQNSQAAAVINVVNTSGQPSCEAVDVQNAINAASDSDTVFVPAGSCTWTTTVNVTKAITLQGAGIDKTIITDATTSSARALKIDVASGYVRVANFTFIYNSDDSFGVIFATGGTDSLRIDHNKIDMSSSSSGDKAMNISNSTYGVIDNNEFVNIPTNGQAIRVTGFSGTSWLYPLSLGTANSVYIEKNTFNHLCGNQDCVAGIIEHEYGGRSVIRHNTFNSAGIMTHGNCNQSTASAVFSYEIYNNTFAVTTTYHPYRAITLRGGTGLIFNNTITGSYSTTLQAYWERSCAGASQGCNVNWTRCNGQPYARTDHTLSDGLQAVMNGAGTHSGSDNASTLTDSGKSWTPSAFVGFYVYNQTDGSNCLITDNDATTVSCILSGGTENDWDSGDIYKITDGYPCYQQHGRTYEQASFPIYTWDNTKNGTSTGLSLSETRCDAGTNPKISTHVQADRDYYNYIADFNGTSGVGSGVIASRPADCTTGVGYWATDEGEWDSTHSGADGRLYRCTATNTWTLAYTPYTYPHPLTLGDDTTPPSAPTGVGIE